MSFWGRLACSAAIAFSILAVLILLFNNNSNPSFNIGGSNSGSAEGGNSSSTEEKHTHKFSDWETALKPTCTADGTRVHGCECGYRVGETIKPLGHNMVDDVCTNCGRSYYSTGLVYVSNGDGTCYVGGIGSCTDTDVIIPATSPEGDTVTAIGDLAFSCCNIFTSITVPKAVTELGDYAFYGCTANTILFEEGSQLTTIGDFAFQESTSLSNIELPETVMYIGQNSFDKTKIYDNKSYWVNGIFYISKCLIKAESKISGEQTITYEILTIADGAFAGCTSLKGIKLPATTTYVGKNAFNGCTTLTSANIPSSVTSIQEGTFNNCSKLTYILLPSNATYIGKAAFKGCVALSEITIPMHVEYIGDEAFRGCKELKTVAVTENDKMISIGYSAFRECVKLESIELNNSAMLDSIASCAFQGCSALVGVTIPASVTFIGDEAFRDCAKMASIAFADNSQLDYISRQAFIRCEALKSVTIPEGVSYIGAQAFRDCTALSEIIINSNNAQILDNVFTNTDYYNINENWVGNVLYINNHLIEARSSVAGKYIIPDGTKTIASCAFYTCDELTGLAMPASIETISCCAFKGCEALTNITFPDGYTKFTVVNGVLYDENGFSRLYKNHILNNLDMDSSEFADLYIHAETGAILANTPGVQLFEDKKLECEKVTECYCICEYCNEVVKIYVFKPHNPNEDDICVECGIEMDTITLPKI